MALFLSFASFSFINLVTRPVACFPGDIGTVKCPLTSAQGLGTWFNMPTTATCNGFTLSQYAGPCELLGNISYRSHMTGAFTGLSVSLGIGCLQPSNTMGANLQLQYAIYTSASQNNSTNYQNIGSAVFIDASTSVGCGGGSPPAFYTIGTSGSLNTTATGYIFRVIGNGGGGSGDNPRFTLVQAVLTESFQQEYQPEAISISTTACTCRVVVNTQGTYTAFNVFWVATNQTSSCGAGDSCFQSGTSSCTITSSTFCTLTVSFSPAFTGTVRIVMTPQRIPTLITFSAGSLVLLRAQTLTV